MKSEETMGVHEFVETQKKLLEKFIVSHYRNVQNSREEYNLRNTYNDFLEMFEEFSDMNITRLFAGNLNTQ